MDNNKDRGDNYGCIGPPYSKPPYILDPKPSYPIGKKPH